MKFADSSSDWRLHLADKIAAIYSDIPDAKAMAVLGGLARGRADEYSDLDLTVFWAKLPTRTEHGELMQKYEDVLNTPVVLDEFMFRQFDGVDVLWEQSAYIGGAIDSGFKIDVNHMPVDRLSQIIEDVTQKFDTTPLHLEICYSIQHVHPLLGDELIHEWQARVQPYPDRLAEKLIRQYLNQAKLDIEAHIKRGDKALVATNLVRMHDLILGILLALNHIYQPELKRIDYICEELVVKPEDLAIRLNQIFSVHSREAIVIVDELFADVLALVQQRLPDVDTDAVWKRYFSQRRQPFKYSPIELDDQS